MSRSPETVYRARLARLYRGAALAAPQVVPLAREPGRRQLQLLAFAALLLAAAGAGLLLYAGAP